MHGVIACTITGKQDNTMLSSTSEHEACDIFQAVTQEENYLCPHVPLLQNRFI